MWPSVCLRQQHGEAFLRERCAWAKPSSSVTRRVSALVNRRLSTSTSSCPDSQRLHTMPSRNPTCGGCHGVLSESSGLSVCKWTKFRVRSDNQQVSGLLLPSQPPELNIYSPAQSAAFWETWLRQSQQTWNGSSAVRQNVDNAVKFFYEHDRWECWLQEFWRENPLCTLPTVTPGGQTREQQQHPQEAGRKAEGCFGWWSCTLFSGCCILSTLWKKNVDLVILFTWPKNSNNNN